MNIYEKMAAITSALKTVAKNLSVKAGNGTYKAVSERDILDAVKPLEEEYGIYSYPCDRKILESSILENEKTYQGNTTKTSTFFTRMQTTYKFVNIEDPEDFITTIVFSEGIDSQDKGSGKAMTYADKYALMKAYKISTGDDPDGTGSEDGYYKRSNSAPPPPPPPPPSQSNNEVTLPKCDKCGDWVYSTLRKDGTMMTAFEVAEFSQKHFGAKLCTKCQRELLNANKEGA